MAEARCRQQWAQTAGLMALLANVHRDPKKRPTPFLPDEFNPYADVKREEPVVRVGVDFLAKTFIDPKG